MLQSNFQGLNFIDIILLFASARPKEIMFFKDRIFTMFQPQILCPMKLCPMKLLTVFW